MATKNNDDRLYVISYFTLRKAVGVLGIVLPILLVFGNILATGEWKILNSISSYYHTIMRNGFVGILCGVALFMFSYRGHKYIDNLAGDLACIFALGIAFFPNNTANPSDIINILHLISAILFFLVLIFFSLVLFTKTDPDKEMTAQKKNRNTIYYTCGFTMLGSILSIAIYMLWIKGKYPAIDSLSLVFWFETIALFAFGLSWLTKGQAILKDKEQ
jgi:hypothetical protein